MLVTLLRFSRILLIVIIMGIAHETELLKLYKILKLIFFSFTNSERCEEIMDADSNIEISVGDGSLNPFGALYNSYSTYQTLPDVQETTLYINFDAVDAVSELSFNPAHVGEVTVIAFFNEIIVEALVRSHANVT